MSGGLDFVERRPVFAYRMGFAHFGSTGGRKIRLSIREARSVTVSSTSVTRSLETTVARLGNRRHRSSTLSHVAQGSFRKGRQRPSLFADDDPIVLAGETFFAL